MNAITVPTRATIKSSAYSDPHWCLPPRFWKRAAIFEGYDVYPVGNRMGWPVRECHVLSLRLVANNQCSDVDLDVCTGHGFSEGLWFRHTWVVNEAEKTILECSPIHPFEVYFGIILTKEEQQQFGEILDIEEYRRK